MKKIAVVTATRAEYGLLSPIIKELRKYEKDDLEVDLIVTGTHLSEEYGMTIQEIIEDMVRIDYQIQIPVKSDNCADISHNQAVTLEKFTKLFCQQGYSAIVILGDRYEILSVAIAAGNTKTPIFHICGGDTTEGAIDEWIRHAITKMAYLHFVTNDVSLKRVIQLGEDPSRVFNYGSTSIDNIITIADMSKSEALESVGLQNCRFALCTFHPVTMSNDNVEEQISAFLGAIKSYPEIEFIVTKSNADHGGTRINCLLDEMERNVDNIHVYTSLGVRRYLSLMKYSEFILGNSSSGIIEAPAFRIPTVNIGDRQKGRLQSDSIINCGNTIAGIVEAIDIATSNEHRKLCQKVTSPYGDGHAAERIAAKTVEVIKGGGIDLRKKFYEIVL